MIGKMLNAAGAGAVTIAHLAFGSALVALPAPAFAETYWGCENGYQFQVNRNAARCFRPSQTETLPPIPCARIDTPMGAIGSALRVDNNGRNDVCATNVGGLVFTGEVACLPGWSIERRTGSDRCQRREASNSKMPERAVVR